MIPGLPDADSAAVLALLKQQPGLEQVLLHDPQLLGARLDDLLLPWRFDLQLQHRIDHPALLAHIDRVGVSLLNESSSI